MNITEYFANPAVITERKLVAETRVLRTFYRDNHKGGARVMMTVGKSPCVVDCKDFLEYQACSGQPFEQLLIMVDTYDGFMARLHVEQAESEQDNLGPLVRDGRRVRQPQDLRRRRSAIFGGADLPPDVSSSLTKAEVYGLVDMIRRELIREAMENMLDELDLFSVREDEWQLRPSAMDRYYLAEKPDHGPGIKPDNRSYHGHPQSHRGRVVTST